ncbi:hypothetical protein JKF63_07985 [Porcisia hertigi]|uniref:Uncharacterized protein n=1 Tax=Porcisia hertigi TaxID=2761500 RepID=A0A836HGA8_9TRYP|nr:hypothetical protein JKF63_07985 [Porcisia hertigi]
MDSSNRRADKTPVAPSKMDASAKGSKSGSFTLGASAPSYTSGEDGAAAPPPPPPPPPPMPYYGQYPSMCALPPGATSMGFPMPPQLGAGSPQGWMPGMMPLPHAANPNTTLPPHPYVSPYGATAQPMVYMPMPYNYPPYMTAAVTASAAAMPPPFNGQQTTKLATQGATPSYTPAAAAPPPPHSSTVEPAMSPPPFMETPSTNSAGPVPPMVPAPVPVSSTVAVEHTVMPLMPNIRLPPGDPFCPAGVSVPSQYAAASVTYPSGATKTDASLLPPPQQCNSVTSGFPSLSSQSEGQRGMATAATDTSSS